MTESRIPPNQETAPPAPVSSREVAIDAELHAWSSRLRLLVEVNAALAATLDTDTAYEQIVSRLREVTRGTHASIYRLIPEERLLRCVAESGYASPEAHRTLSLDGKGVVAYAAQTREAVYVPDVTVDPRYLCGHPSVRSEYAVPLLVGSAVLGVLEIESDLTDGIRAVTRRLVDQLTAQVALGLHCSNLYRQLQASEQRFRSIFEQGQLGVALGNLEGRFLNANRAYEQILGYAPGELCGLHFTETVHPEEHGRSLSDTRELLEGRIDHFHAEGRRLRKSGELVWCAVNVSLIRDAADRPAYALIMLQDISGRKKAEEERTRLQEQLFHAQKMKAMGTLAGGIAHDFNNLLGVIQGYASLLQLRLPPQDNAREPVRMIEQSARRAAELTRQLLQFARQESSRAENVNTGEVVAQVLKIVTETFDRRIRIETRLAPELPCVTGDPGQLELAILNLCINARDAMSEGGTLTVATSVVNLGGPDAPCPTQCSPGEYIRIAIKDTGVGIEPTILPRIFEPFFTTKEPGKGSGLGLATVYAVASHHAGFVQAASQASVGSEFMLYLPVSARASAPPVAAPPAQAARGSGTVLVVDDEPFMLAFVAEALQELGYKVLTATDGKQACDIYVRQAEEIDCVLLDVVMPQMSGMETQEALRAINPHVKVIFTSGYSGSGEVQRALESGAACFLGKPCTVETLAQTLKKIQLDNETSAGAGTREAEA